MTNNVSSYTTAINDNFAAVKAAISNLESNPSRGLCYSATNSSAITPTNGVGSWTVTHNLNTNKIIASLYSGSSEIIKNTVIDSVNVVTLTFKASSTIAVGNLKVVIMGV